MAHVVALTAVLLIAVAAARAATPAPGAAPKVTAQKPAVSCYAIRREQHHNMALDSCQAIKDKDVCLGLGEGTRSYGQYGGRGGFDSIASCCDQLGYLWGNNPMTGTKDPKLGAQGKAKCLENAKKEYGANTPQAFKPGNPSEKFNILWPSCYLVNPKNKGQCMAAGYGEGLGDTGNLCNTAPGNKYSAISKTKQGGWGSLEECCAGTFKGKPAEVKACQAESRKAWPYAVHTYSDSVPKGVRATMQYEAQAGSAKELTAMATADGLKLAALGCKGDDEWVRKTFPEDVGKLAAC